MAGNVGTVAELVGSNEQTILPDWVELQKNAGTLQTGRITESELHGGIPTDRLIAEWWLDSPRVERVLASERSPDENGGSVAISLPADIAKIRSTDQSQAIQLQSRVREEFQRRFAEGYVATTVISREDAMEYILEPAASIPGLRLPEYRPHESED